MFQGEEILSKRRFIKLGLDDLTEEKMDDLIIMCYRCRVLESTNCAPEEEFDNIFNARMEGLISPWVSKDRFLDIVKAAFARAGAVHERKLRVPRLVANIIVILLYLIPPNVDVGFEQIARDYKGPDRQGLPVKFDNASAVMVYLASLVEQSAESAKYLKTIGSEEKGFIAELV